MHKKEAKEAAMKKRREEKERSNSQPTSNSIAATALSSDAAEVDSNRTKDDVITIDGETILIGDIAKPGIDSDRARKRKLRAITPALPSSTQTRHPRTSAPVRKGLQYTRASFNQFIAKPWSVTTKDGKKIGGKDKRGHGLIIKNGRLFCDRCMTPIAHKPTQHMISVFTRSSIKMLNTN